jgi:cell division inhibitor SulA
MEDSILRELLEIQSRGNLLISCRLALSGDWEVRAAGLPMKQMMWWKQLGGMS